MNSASGSYGTSRERAASVSYAEIEATARRLMGAGGYPSVGSVRKALKRGSTTTIAEAMQRFWKDQAALNAGNPVALTRLPPEFADAAVELWEQALRLSLQTAQQGDSVAHAKLEELKRDTDARARSLELREKEWDMAARVRERALTDTREQVNMLLKQLGQATADVRARDTRIADLETQVEEHRRQLATVIVRAVSKSRERTSRSRRPAPLPESKKRSAKTARRVSINRKSAKPKRKGHGKRR